MSESGSKYFTGGRRDLLAAAVVSRRKAIGWTQRQACGHGGLSDERLRQFESGSGSERIQLRTLALLDEAICWHPGSALAVLGGGEPTDAPVPPEPRRPSPGSLNVTVGLTDGGDWMSALLEPSWWVDGPGHLHVHADGEPVATFSAGHWRFVNKDGAS